MRHHPKLQQRPWTNTPLTFVLRRNKQINVLWNCHCQFKLSAVRDEFGMTFRLHPIITFPSKDTVAVCHQNQAESAVDRGGYFHGRYPNPSVFDGLLP